MTQEEAIKYLRQIYPNGGHSWLDSQRIEAIEMAIMALSNPSLPSNLDEAAEKYSENILANNEDLQDAIEDAFKAGAEWMAGQFQQEQPEVDLEKEFAHEYAIYHLPNFIIASIVDGTELIDFIYKTARHFYELGLNARKKG